MRLVTVATHSERYFPYLLESCKRFGAKLDVLGWGKPWGGFMMKYDLIQDYLKDVDDNEIICVIDAYDVILLEPLQKLEAIFKRTGARIAVARDCTPNMLYFQYAFGKCKNLFVNAGTYMGYVKDVRKMVSDICKMNNCKDKRLDDQRIITAYCNVNSLDMHIDVKRELFFLFCAYNSNPTIADGKIIYNHINPCILHGPANTNMDAVLRQLGYNVENLNHNIVQYWVNFCIHHWQITLVVGIILFVLICTVVCTIAYCKKHSRKALRRKT